MIQFHLTKQSDVNLRIYDQQGRLLAVLMKGRQVLGSHQVLLGNLILPEGVLFIDLQINGIIKKIKLLNLKE